MGLDKCWRGYLGISILAHQDASQYTHIREYESVHRYRALWPGWKGRRGVSRISKRKPPKHHDHHWGSSR